MPAPKRGKDLEHVSPSVLYNTLKRRPTLAEIAKIFRQEV